MLQVWKGCAELHETGGVCYWGLSGLLSFVGGMFFCFFFHWLTQIKECWNGLG